MDPWCYEFFKDWSPQNVNRVTYSTSMGSCYRKHENDNNGKIRRNLAVKFFTKNVGPTYA